MFNPTENSMVQGFALGFMLGAVLWVVFYTIAYLVGLPFPAFWGMPIGVVAGGAFGLKLRKMEEESDEESD